MAKPKSLRVILIRSGSTEWDVRGRVSGSADHPMCEQGAADLASAIRELELTDVAAVLHGPDEASTSTGNRVASLSRAKARSKDGLGEVSMGLWEGLLPGDLEDRYPTVYGKWLEDPAAVSVPEGEPLVEADARLRAAFLKSVEKVANDGTVVVVLRPIAWALMRCRLLGRPLSALWSGLREAGQVESLSCQTASLRDSAVEAEGAAAQA
ncbi:MAG: histidine phosphatase family protein [Planctomycetota bacterium]